VCTRTISGLTSSRLRLRELPVMCLQPQSHFTSVRLGGMGRNIAEKRAFFGKGKVAHWIRDGVRRDDRGSSVLAHNVDP
jgi:hypothetical protein